MSDSKYAPGPWECRNVAGAGLQISATLPQGFNFSGTGREADGKTSFMIWTVRESYTVQIADERWVQFSTGSWDEMQQANARLIAAAPETIEQLEATCTALEEAANIIRPTLPSLADNVLMFQVRRARAAIAKAKGEPDAAP